LQVSDDLLLKVKLLLCVVVSSERVIFTPQTPVCLYASFMISHLFYYIILSIFPLSFPFVPFLAIPRFTPTPNHIC
jgi:hypothetical protein